MKDTAIKSAQPQEGQHVVHLAISNQSIAQAQATLHVTIDGHAVFSRDLETKTQHNWQELTRSLRSGPHLVEVQELSTGAAQRLHLDLTQETWVIIMFSSPPPTLSIQAQQTPANFL